MEESCDVEMTVAKVANESTSPKVAQSRGKSHNFVGNSLRGNPRVPALDRPHEPSANH